MIPGDKEVRSVIAAAASESPISEAAQGPVDGAVPLEQWLKNIKYLYQASSGMPPITVPTSEPSVWIDASPEVIKDPILADNLLPGSALVDALIATLSLGAGNGEFSANSSNAVRLTVRHAPQAGWDTLIEAINTRLSTTPAVPLNAASNMLYALWNLRLTQAQVVPTIQLLTQNGSLLHYMAEIPQGNHARTAYYLVSVLESCRGTWPQSDFLKSADGLAVCQQFWSGVRSEDEVTDVVMNIMVGYKLETFLDNLLVNDSAGSPFVARVLWRMFRTRQDLIPQYLSLDSFVARFTALRSALSSISPTAIDELTRTMNQKSALTTRISQSDYSSDLVPVYLALVRTGVRHQRLIPKLVKGLQTISLDEWRSDLDGNMHHLTLALEMIDQNIRFALGPAVRRFLKDHAESLANGGAAPEIEPDHWSSLATRLDQDQLPLLQRDLYVILRDSGGEASAGFFHYYGQLIDAQTLAEDPQAVHDVLTPILEKRSKHGLEWIRSILQTSPTFFRGGFTRASINDFRRLVEEAQAETDSSFQETLAFVSLALPRRSSRRTRPTRR